MQWAQIEIQEMPFKHQKKLFYSKDGQVSEQVASAGQGVSILGDTKNSGEHSPEL